MTTHPDGFHRLRLLLAREHEHPAGDRHHGYEMIAPLTSDGKLDALAWHANPGACGVRRFRPDEEDWIGHLARKPGGQWYVDYGTPGHEDETFFRLGQESFVAGEYVSIREEDGQLHTFKVASVESL